MATFRRFEDIEAWQSGRALTRAVYAASRRGAFGRDDALRNQIRRAAISVTSNIAEGFERSSDRAFAHFLSVAKGSAGEVRSQLYVALDEGYLSESEFEHLYGLSLSTIKRISRLMTYLRGSTNE
ncbi:MAG: four helix bundle protein [Bacteroidetes bacterium]|jgi:four helix bundle protein|nr:four helix bundle protein [Bacteroidota bacterium]